MPRPSSLFCYPLSLSFSLILTHLLYTFTHSLARSLPPSLSLFLYLSNLCDLSFFLFQTDSLPKRFSKSSNTSKSFFESTSTVESSRLVQDQRILLFSSALLLLHFLFFFLPTHIPYTSRLLQQLREKLRDQER